MECKQAVCLLNDSFPPLIDGVANAVMNYAGVIQESEFDPIVITPYHPDENDALYPYPVIRYPSMDLRKMTGYMAGIPFSPEVIQQLSGRKIALLHSHCPVASTILGRELRQIYDAPLVLTYHTKFDIDIENILKSRALQEGSKFALLQNINACDEVWAVSQGAVENLKALGYEGDCIVMPNGVDLPKERVSEDAIKQATKAYDLPENVPVFLFVGRMMWYKGLKITIDALAMLRKAGYSFRMVFIGSGADLEEVTAYAGHCGIQDCCIFTGPIRDRQILRAWYCRADLFLFPSTFDTNGLVVREAAACSLGSVLIRGSCAAEGVTDSRNGLLIEENPESMFACLQNVLVHPEKMAQIGHLAAEELYVSWEDSVRNAEERYRIVIDRYQSGRYPSHRKPMEEVLKANGALMEDLAHLQSLRQTFRTHFRQNIRENIRDRFPGQFPESIRDTLPENLPERIRENIHHAIQQHKHNHS